MAIPTDPAKILKSVTDPNGTKAALDLTAAATQPTNVEQPDMQIGVDDTAPAPADASASVALGQEAPTEPAKPIQVAGRTQTLRDIGNAVLDKFNRRVDDAQTRTQPPMKDEPIQFVGDAGRTCTCSSQMFAAAVNAESSISLVVSPRP